MSSQRDYTPDEWSIIQQAPVFASMYVMTGDKPNPLEQIREIRGINKALTVAPPTQARVELTEALIAATKAHGGPPEPDIARVSAAAKSQPGAASGKMSLNEARAMTLQGALDAVTIVARKAPTELEAFKRFLYYVAEATAKASHEGGFLGFGGTPISPGEALLLSDLTDELGIEPEAGA